MVLKKVYPIALLFSQLHSAPPCLSALSLCSHFHGPRSTTGPQQVKQGPEFTYQTHELYVHSVSVSARICLQPRHNVQKHFFNEEHASVTCLAEDISGAVLRKYALVLLSHTPLSVEMSFLSQRPDIRAFRGCTGQKPGSSTHCKQRVTLIPFSAPPPNPVRCALWRAEETFQRNT